MIVPIPERAAPPIRVEGAVDPDLEGFRFAGPAEVSIDVSREGSILHLEGSVSGTVLAACDRCLRDVARDVREDFVTEIDLAEGRAAAVDIGLDEPDLPVERVEGPDGGEAVDVTEEIRMRLAQAIPDRVLCRVDCRGLCPRCGADRNAGPCGCAESAPGVRNPFSSLGEFLEGRV